MHDLDDLSERRDALGEAWGVIAAWGDLEVHEDGFRAEHAQVLAIAVPEWSERQRSVALAYLGRMEPDAELATVAGFYGVPLLELGDLSAYGEKFGRPLPTHVRPAVEIQDELHVWTKPQFAVLDDEWAKVWKAFRALGAAVTTTPATAAPDERRSSGGVILPWVGDVAVGVDFGFSDSAVAIVPLTPRQPRGP